MHVVEYHFAPLHLPMQQIESTHTHPSPSLQLQSQTINITWFREIAEEGCLQYFSGVAGQIRSFNYDPTSGRQLSNQDYSICIRTERNFCGIQYTQCPDEGNQFNRNTGNLFANNIFSVDGRNQSFTLSGNSNNAVQAMVGSTGTANFCQADYLIIPMAMNIGRTTTGIPSSVDRICGGVLSADITLQPTSIRSKWCCWACAMHCDAFMCTIHCEQTFKWAFSAKKQTRFSDK